MKERFLQKKSPPSKAMCGRLKLLLLLIAFVLSASSAHASKDYYSDWFQVAYEPAHARYKITLVMHETEGWRGSANAFIDYGTIAVSRENGNWENLFDVDGENHTSDGFRVKYYKGDIGAGSFESAFGLTRIYNTDQRVHINLGSGGLTSGSFYWYPDESWVGLTPSFCLRYGAWERNNAGNNYFNHSYSKSAGQMENKLNNINITENILTSDGNNQISYTITNYNTAYDKGKIYLQRLTDGGSWTDVANQATALNGTFKGKYMQEAENFHKGVRFRLENRITPNPDYYNVVVFRRQSAETTTEKFATFNNFSAKVEGKTIKLTWTYSEKIGGDQNTDNLELLILKPGVTDWNNAVKKEIIFDKTQTSGETTYELSNDELQNKTKNYKFIIRKKSFVLDGVWANLFQKTASTDINTNYKEINLLNHTTEGTSVILNWTLGSSGIPLNSDLEYVVKINGTAQSEKPSIDATSHKIHGLEKCKTMTISLHLVMKAGNRETSTKSLEKVMIPNSTASVIEDLRVSKGYYTDKVMIDWSIPNEKNNFDYFILSRKQLGSDEPPVTLAQLDYNKNIYSYSDNNIDAGVYYDYIITGYAECNSVVDKASEVNSVGFSQPYASVTGRISYGGNQAVEAVDVMVVGDDAMQNRGLDFSSNRGIGNYVSIPAKAINPNAFSFQAWIKPTSQSADERKDILSYDFRVYLENNKININSNDVVYTDTTTIDLLKYTHVTLTVNQLDIQLFINGNLVNEFKINRTKAIPQEILVGNSSITGVDGFDGYMDELRVWSKVLSAKEIAANYDRFLNGKENGLSAYYRCDEWDEIERVLYDISAIKSNFNKNDAAFGAAVMRTARPEDLPSNKELSNKAKTDQHGNYLINTIPYTNEGNVYNITPFYGVHNFNPNSRPVFVSPSSRSLNNIDFTDVSSFEVTGKITYKNTDYPVEGVNFYIDGLICSKNSEIIKSKSDGTYTISVPIGKHFITIAKEGHSFVNEGRYPPDPHSVGPKIAIEKPITNLNFVDSTLVTVVGRVSGGEIEGKQPLGLGQSKANIGKATIKLQIPDGGKYSLNETDKKIELESGNDHISNKAWVNFKSDTVTIETNSENGEFVVQLPPIPFKVVDISTGKLGKENLNISQIPNFEIKNPNLKYTDSISTDDKGIISFTYHHAINVNYRAANSTLIVNDRATDVDKAFGEKIVSYIDEHTGKSEDVEIYRIDPDTKEVTNTFDYPVFLQKNKYAFDLYAFEQYENWDNKEEVVVDRVPLKESVVTIRNEIGIQSVYIEGDDSGKITDIKENEIQLDEEGKATYRFTAGFPNINGNHLLSLNIQYTNGDKKEKWPKNGDFKAYVFGLLPSGNDFATSGPDKVSMILRDPPGSNSNAFWEEGSTYTNTSTRLGSFLTSNALTTTIHAGLEESVIAGTPLVGTISDVKSKADVEIGVKYEYSFENNETSVNKTVLTKKISTSDSPDFVGASGDVFIGNSTNFLFGMSRNVNLKKDAYDSFSIGKEDVMTLGSEFNTAFRYTTNHIENNLIPDLFKLRNSILKTVSEGEYNENYANMTNNPIYITLLDPSNPRFGSNNDDVDVWGEEVVASDKLKGPSFMMIIPDRSDSVYDNKVVWYNSQINTWRNTLAENEKVKLEAISGKAKHNYSFDAGASVESSTSICSSSSNTWTHEHKVQVVAGVNTGFRFKGVGLSVGFKTENTGSFSHSSGDENETCTTTGYSLADGDAGNYFSVDVFEPSDRFGVIFRTRGGQSSCPYEGAELTKYHKKGTELSAATMQIEVPKLAVNEPFATEIPAGKEATYTLVLNNNSEAEEDCLFSMRVLDESNPDGALLSMDGAPLVGRRDIFVKSEKGLSKTLKLKQTSGSILDYPNIKIVLASKCEDNIADTISISAQFVPTCSDLTLNIEDRIVNVETSDTLSVRVKDYEMSYKNFKAIRLQYKSTSDINWNLMQEYVLNNEDKTQNNELLLSANIAHKFPMTSLSDGIYEIRAISVCSFGSGEVFNATPIIQITKDMSPPASLGLPNPSNGILSPENEVSILFNEHIQSGKLTFSNFKVQGVLNGYTVRDNVGLDFDGNSNAYSELPITANGSFSIEGWFKPELSGGGTLFTYGRQEDYISLGLTSDNKVTVTSEKQEPIVSDIQITDTGWQYISFTYDRSNNKVGVFLNGSVSLFTDKELKDGAPQTGRFYLGSDINGGNSYKGRMRQIHFWNKTRSQGELFDMNIGKSGNEQNLIGYWNLEEGHGDVAVDKARNRNLVVNSDWFIYPNGKSISFNGSNDYLTLDSKLYPFTENNDFSIEFWFKGDKQSPATLLSVGHGIDDKESKGKLSIAANKDGNLILRSSGKEFQLATKSVMDNQWHHFAMSVARRGNVVAYVDNKQTFQKPAVEVGRLASDNIYIGAAHYNTESGSVTKEHFKGSIDEVRIWNSALVSDNFKLDTYNKLSGGESGLVAYYPFEEYTKDSGNQLIITKSLNDMTVSENGTPSSLIASGAVNHSDNTPPIKDQRPIEDVTFNWTSSDDKVVINLTEPLSRIENCILEFTAERILDMQNNRMASPVKWTAYVNMNRLKWQDDGVSLEKDVYAPLTFKTVISNKSGVNEAYSISNIPSWLTCNTPTGVITPQQNKEITFVVNEAIGIGSYESTLSLTGSNNVSEAYVVSLKVKGDKPNWSVDPGKFETSMTVTGQLKIENIYQEDSDDIVAAFIDGECRGIASPRYIKIYNSYYLFMDVYGDDVDSKKAIDFQIWDASTGRTFAKAKTSENIVFASMKQQGSISAPIIIDALNVIDQQLSLKKGWNWVSVSVENQDPSLLEMFKKGIGDAGLILKNAVGYVQYPTWSGSMSEINNTTMYRLQTSKQHSLSFTGRPIDVKQKPITINKGWNWIGYLPSSPMTVDYALASIEAQTGDQVRGHAGYATYVEGAGWLGNLNQMKPGLGYMYNSLADNVTLIYPSTSLLRNALADAPESVTHWKNDPFKFATNMTITAIVLIDKEVLRSDKYELGLFKDGECRGSALLKYESTLDNYIAYLMVGGDTGDELSYQIYDHTSGKELIVEKENVNFTSDGSLGRPDSPHEVHLVVMNATGIVDVTTGSSPIVYPSPAANNLCYKLPAGDATRIEIRDISGRIVIVKENPQSNVVDVSKLVTGSYFIYFYMWNNAIKPVKFLKK